MDIGREISVYADDIMIFGTIESSVKITEVPTQNGESNFEFVGVQYAYYEDDPIANIDDKWMFFERDKRNC